MTARRPDASEPTPVYLSTTEQIVVAAATVAALVAIILPWQLDADGIALWLPVLLGATAFALTWVVTIRAVIRRSGDPASRPAPEVSRRRSLIASVALVVGIVAISIRLFVLD